MNWGEMQNEMKQYLENYEDSFVANFPLFARLAEEDIYRKVQLPMTRETAQMPLTFNVRTLNQPPDLISVHSMAVYDSGGEQNFLLAKDQAFLREAYPDPSFADVPRYYAIMDEVDFLLAPTPIAGLSVELVYFKKPDSISKNGLDDNSNWLSKNGENALLFGAVMHGYIYLKGDQDVIAAYKDKFENGLADLKVIAEGRQRKDTYRTLDQRLPT